MKFIENIYLLPKDIFSLKGIFKNTEILIINVSPKRIEIDGDHTNPLIWPLTESLKDYEISILNTQSGFKHKWHLNNKYFIHIKVFDKAF